MIIIFFRSPRAHSKNTKGKLIYRRCPWLYRSFLFWEKRLTVAYGNDLLSKIHANAQSSPIFKKLPKISPVSVDFRPNAALYSEFWLIRCRRSSHDQSGMNDVLADWWIDGRTINSNWHQSVSLVVESAEIARKWIIIRIFGKISLE